jgi:CRP-like cAMP-binding protein
MEHSFEANFFTLLELLDVGSRLQIDAVCTQRSAQPQEIIYGQGDHADSIYIVAAGVVEALTQSPDGLQTRSVGFMGRGDFFGDLAVLTGQPRLAMVRACEETQLLRIEKMAFLQLLEKIPKLSAYFCRNLARRLYKTSTEAHLTIYQVDLSGNLRHFDLLTIFQAITSMARSGELQLNNSAYELIGSFFFRDGKVEHARFAHLDGVEAVWQGFVESCCDGSFTFRVVDQPSVPFTEEHRVDLACTDLLMQGVARRDAYHALSEPLRRMEGRLGRVAELLVWTEPETQTLAGRIWELMAKRPQPLDSMWRRLNYSSLTFLEVVNQMIALGQVEWMKTAGPENQTESQPLPQP